MIGVISDTHGLLRPEALKALEGSELIIHAGDVGSLPILDRLRAIAPVVVVRGNVDNAPGLRDLPENEVVELGGLAVYILHDIGTLNLDPTAAGFRAVIYGHSHQPMIEMRDDVLYLNPGSAGPRRFSLPVSLATLEVGEGSLQAHLIELDV